VAVHVGGRGPGHMARTPRGGGIVSFATVFGASLVAWYDASDAASITQSAGAVSQWDDKSGNGYHLKQATGSRQPVYSVTGLGGTKPSISFTNTGGAEDFLATDVDTVAGNVSSFAAFFVGRINSGSASNGRILSFLGTGQTLDYNNNPSCILILRESLNAAVGGYRSSPRANRALAYDTTGRVASVWDNVNNTIYVNNVAGTPAADTGGSLASVGTLFVGDDVAIAGGLTGHVSELAFVKIAPSAGQISTVDAMLSAKWT
jgi:hypothetical protein